MIMQILQREQTHGRLLVLIVEETAFGMGVVLSPPLIGSVILPAAGKEILDVGDGKGVVGPPKPPLDTEKLE